MGKLKDLTLLNFKEFGTANAPSISTLFVAEKYEHQKEIIDYLENGKISLAAPGLEIDGFTGETIIPRHTKAILTDGVYSRSGSLSYYVEKYNARLPHEIEDWMLSQHIKNKTGKSIEVKDEDILKETCLSSHHMRCNGFPERLIMYDNKENVTFENLKEVLRLMSSSVDEERSNNPWIKRCQSLPSYTLDVVQDGSDGYYKALTEAVLAITRGEYGSIDYKGYRIFYNDTPHLGCMSLEDGHKEYSRKIRFDCAALMCLYDEEYHSEEERKAYMDPENRLFRKTLTLLDKVIKELDEGTWLN